MLYGQDRNQMRQYFYDIWQKANNNETLEAMEKIIAGIINQHPEYHAVLQNRDTTLESDYLPESGQSNPFLHMGMHIALHEQLMTQRPAGIVAIYQSLMTQSRDQHDCEHRMIECLAEMLWQSQKDAQAPNEQAYLDSLRSLLKS